MLAASARENVVQLTFTLSMQTVPLPLGTVGSHGGPLTTTFAPVSTTVAFVALLTNAVPRACRSRGAAGSAAAHIIARPSILCDGLRSEEQHLSRSSRVAL